MDALWLEIARTVGSAIGLASGIFITYWRITQSARARELKLEDNPERCGRHEEAIKSIRLELDKVRSDNKEDHRIIFNQLGALSVEIARLGRGGSVEK